MGWNRGGLGVFVALCALALPATAGATVIGSLDPANTNPGFGGDCVGSTASWLQAGTSSTDPSYTVPAGGGTITNWSTRWGTPGATAGLEVWAPSTSASGQYTLAAIDYESLAPGTDGVSTFPVSIPVQAGEVLGIYVAAANTVDCGFELPAADNGSLVTGYGGAVSPGDTINFNLSDSVFEQLDNIAAVVHQSADLGLTESASPTTVHSGDDVQLLFRVSDYGPSSSPATFTDTLPAGLSAISAVAQNGSCTIGSTVSCQLGTLAPGTSDQISVVASVSRAGKYNNEGAITGLSTNTDPNPTNNTASASFTSPSPPAVTCKVPKLKGLTLAKAKKALTKAHCAAGKVTKPKHHTRTLVVKRQSIGAGKVKAAGTKVALRLGPKPQ